MVSFTVRKNATEYYFIVVVVAVFWVTWVITAHQNEHFVIYVLLVQFRRSQDSALTDLIAQSFFSLLQKFVMRFVEHFLGDSYFIIFFSLHSLLCKRASELLWNRWKSWTCSSQHPEGEGWRCQGERRISVQLSYSFQDKWGNGLSVILQRNWKVNLELRMLDVWLWICC